MTRLRNILTRIGASVALVALVVIPPALVGALIGRPYPQWSTLTSEFDSGQVSADTVMRVAALLFIAIWVWIVTTIAAETSRIIRQRELTDHRARRATSAPQIRRSNTFLHRLVRVALLGTVTTAATISTWSTTAIATPNRSLADSLDPTPPVTAPVDPTDARPSEPVTTTIVADGRATPLSIAVDLGDETLRDDIVAMNRSSDWNGGVFPEGTLVTIPIVDTATHQTAEANADVYVVRPNDGLWNVAEAFLGDGSRHHELRRLLDGQEVAPGIIFSADTDVIHPGWTFHRPAAIAATSDHPRHVHVVRAGDSLSAIAEQHLGDPNRWPELWELNDHRQMPDGRTLDDPNLILPGWLIEIPTDTTDVTIHDATTTPPPTTTTPSTPEPREEPRPDPEATPATATTEPGASTIPTDVTDPADELVAPPPVPGDGTIPSPTNLAPPNPSATAPPARTASDSATSESIWTDAQRSVWPTLVVGSLLIAGLAATIRRLRHRRLSRLQPGQRLTEPTDVVAGTEHAIITNAANRPIATITALLRSITPYAAEQRHPPAVRAVQIGTERVEVLFAEPAPLPPHGWVTIDGGHSWTHRFDEPVDEHRQLLTPALVTIGARTDDHGDEVLLDLETAGSLAITGDRTASLGLARSIAFELATYPLGISMDVSLVGVHVAGTEHCDRVWTDSTITRAVRVAQQRLDRQNATGATVTEERAELDDDDGAHDPHVFIVDTTSLDNDELAGLDDLVRLCGPSTGTAVVIIGDHPDANERIVVDDTGNALWSGVDLHIPMVTNEAEEEVAQMLGHLAGAEAELIEPDDLMTALLKPITINGTDSGLEDPTILDGFDVYEPPQHDVLLQVMGEPRAHGVELTADETELLALLTCLRHRTEIHIGLVHDSVAPERARKTIENRMSLLRRKLGTGSDDHDLLPEAAPGRGGRSHYLVSPLVLTDIDLLEHRYHTAESLPSSDALAVLQDGLELMRGPLFRSRRGYEFWPHSEGVIVEMISIIQAYATRLIELAADAERRRPRAANHADCADAFSTTRLPSSQSAKPNRPTPKPAVTIDCSPPSKQRARRYLRTSTTKILLLIPRRRLSRKVLAVAFGAGNSELDASACVAEQDRRTGSARSRPQLVLRPAQQRLSRRKSEGIGWASPT